VTNSLGIGPLSDMVEIPAEDGVRVELKKKSKKRGQLSSMLPVLHDRSVKNIPVMRTDHTSQFEHPKREAG